jgi:hypothetical protein
VKKNHYKNVNASLPQADLDIRAPASNDYRRHCLILSRRFVRR